MRTVLACLLALALLAGCAAPASEPAAGSEPDSLQVVSVGAGKPLNRTLTDPAVVRALYAEMLAIPLLTTSDTNCSVDESRTLALTFRAGGQRLLEATAEPLGGCQAVRLAGPSVRLGLSPQGQRFWSDLARALEITPEALRGTTG